MQLTLYTDYSLRVLMFLAEKGGRSTIREIAEFHAISKNHLTKVVHHLGKLGYLKTTKGKGGGIALAKNPSTFKLSDVVKTLEPGFTLVECFDPATNKCKISLTCKLRYVLNHALGSFMRTLEEYTLADIVRAGSGSPPQKPVPAK
ncbi:MAG: Rrf2 family transcriptional regulator [Bdellovibrionota bacterium]